MTSDQNFVSMREAMLAALKNAPYEQRELLATTDAVYDFLEEGNHILSDEQYLELKMLASQAEGILTRYFGM